MWSSASSFRSRVHFSTRTTSSRRPRIVRIVSQAGICSWQPTWGLFPCLLSLFVCPPAPPSFKKHVLSDPAFPFDTAIGVRSSALVIVDRCGQTDVSDLVLLHAIAFHSMERSLSQALEVSSPWQLLAHLDHRCARGVVQTILWVVPPSSLKRHCPHCGSFRIMKKLEFVKEAHLRSSTLPISKAQGSWSGDTAQLAR